jgi:hypothetical protein
VREEWRINGNVSMEGGMKPINSLGKLWLIDLCQWLRVWQKKEENTKIEIRICIQEKKKHTLTG